MLSPVGRRVCGSQGGASIVASSTRFLSGLDPFLAFLIATVVAATLVPAHGVGATIAGWAAHLAIALLFFLHGAKLSRAAIKGGIGNWRLHLLVLASSF